MPKDKKRLYGHSDMTQADPNEKFRTFFSTSVAQVPDEMNRRDEEREQTEKPKGLLSRLFHRESKPAQPTPDKSDKPKEMPTGEIILGNDDDEPQADLQLAAFQSAPEWEPVEEPDEKAAESVVEQKADEPIAEPESKPEVKAEPVAEIAVQQPPIVADKPAASAVAFATEPVEISTETATAKLKEVVPELRSVSSNDAKAVNSESAKNKTTKPSQSHHASPIEEQEQTEMSKLRAMLGLTGSDNTSDADASQPSGASIVFAQDKAAKPSTAPAKNADKNADKKPEPVHKTETPKASAEEKPHGFDPFTDAEQSAPEQVYIPGPYDSMSISLMPELEEQPDNAKQETSPITETAPETKSEAAEITAEDPKEDDNSPEGIAARLKQMSTVLLIRCAASGLLAFILLQFGLSAGGYTGAVAGFDPITAPTAFYAANILLLAACAGVGYTVMRDGFNSLRGGEPTTDLMPALAMAAALLQAVVALLNAASYAASSLTLLSGIAALGIFTALLGDFIMLYSVRKGFEVTSTGDEHYGAYRVQDKDLIRSLSRDFDIKDPWILLSRPIEPDTSFVDRSLGVRAGAVRLRKTSYVLLGAALLCGLVFLIFGAGINGAAAAMASVLCMGAPLSSSLIPALSVLRLEQSAGAAGAAVPGWAAIEELGGIDTLQVDADELFTPDCVDLVDIRIFKGGRIDKALLYTASVTNQNCSTLRGMFSKIIEDRTDILLPVKDLEDHRGLGYSAWCDNNRVLVGTRAYMESEDIPLPELEYENEHSHNGELQILYLAVSGVLHAMFVLQYRGSRNAARGLDILQKEGIHLLVTCHDPSLTAQHIANAYHLPDGMITLLDQAQCDAVAAAELVPPAAPCSMIHAKSFASLTSGLRAAEQTQTSENLATNVQLASIWFSVAIGVLLTSAGSIGAMSVPFVLLYQVAWSALCIVAGTLKPRG